MENGNFFDIEIWRHDFCVAQMRLTISTDSESDWSYWFFNGPLCASCGISLVYQFTFKSQYTKDQDSKFVQKSKNGLMTFNIYLCILLVVFFSLHWKISQKWFWQILETICLNSKNFRYFSTHTNRKKLLALKNHQKRPFIGLFWPLCMARE